MENMTAWYISILQTRFDLSNISGCTGIPLIRLRSIFLANDDISDRFEFSALVQIQLHNFGELKHLKGSVERYTR